MLWEEKKETSKRKISSINIGGGERKEGALWDFCCFQRKSPILFHSNGQKECFFVFFSLGIGEFKAQLINEN